MPLDERPKRILVVEDEFLLREVIVTELAEAGFDVVEAASGEEALAAVTDVDLLFTDIRLPGGMDGWTIAERARDARPGLPVIYATGYSAEAPRQVDGSHFFAKPYRTSAILDTIRKLVG